MPQLLTPCLPWRAAAPTAGITDVELADIKESIASSEISSPESLLAQLQDETARNRESVNDRLPRETELKHKHLSILQYVLQESTQNEGWTERRLQELQRSNQEKQQDIRALEEKQRESMSKNAGDLQLVQQRQMASMVERKRIDLEGTVETLSQKKEKLAIEYEERLSQGDPRNNEGEEERTPEEVESLKRDVKRLMRRYQQLKASATELSAEMLVLERTQGLLFRAEGAGSEGSSGTLFFLI